MTKALLIKIINIFAQQIDKVLIVQNRNYKQRVITLITSATSNGLFVTSDIPDNLRMAKI